MPTRRGRILVFCFSLFSAQYFIKSSSFCMRKYKIPAAFAAGIFYRGKGFFSIRPFHPYQVRHEASELQAWVCRQ
jgi:hypothetical protein